MFIISCSLLALLPVAFLSVTEPENGTTPYEASLLGNVTINSAENEIDIGHERETESVVVDYTRSMTSETSRFGITLPQPPRSSNNKASDDRGVFFEDGDQPHNVTAKLGTNVLLDCKIGLLYDRTVSWVRKKGDELHLLTVGRNTYSIDQRIELNFRYPNNWRLRITSVTRRDDGLYECQIATHPTMVKKIFLKVLAAPEVQILDENRSPFSQSDLYIRPGSRVLLLCLASHLEENAANSLVWSREIKILSKGITTNTSPGEIASKLEIQKVQSHNTGTYTCAVNELSASIRLHIMNGDLPAAIHGGCSNTMVSCLITICLLTLCSLMVTNYSLPRR